MGTTPRMTGPTKALLETFLGEPERPRYGLELGAALGLPSGTIHPILARLEGVGWLTSGWEDVDASAVGRPQRRYYLLTPTGAQSAQEAVARANEARQRLIARLQPRQA